MGERLVFVTIKDGPTLPSGRPLRRAVVPIDSTTSKSPQLTDEDKRRDTQLQTTEEAPFFFFFFFFFFFCNLPQSERPWKIIQFFLNLFFFFFVGHKHTHLFLSVSISASTTHHRLGDLSGRRHEETQSGSDRLVLHQTGTCDFKQSRHTHAFLFPLFFSRCNILSGVYFDYCTA